VNKKSIEKTQELFEFDGFFGEEKLICGVDEAGRGPLAGPVVCAACVMPRGSDDIIPGINDSKKVPEALREELFERITQCAVCYSVSVIDNQTVDAINILEATKRGMEQAIMSLKTRPDVVLVDAVQGLNIARSYTALIKGDEKSYAIAAASVLAKVTRDRLMREADMRFPGYGFAQNKGYGTKCHIEAFFKFGKTPLHRETFTRSLSDPSAAVKADAGSDLSDETAEGR